MLGLHPLREAPCKSRWHGYDSLLNGIGSVLAQQLDCCSFLHALTASPQRLRDSLQCLSYCYTSTAHPSPSSAQGIRTLIAVNSTLAAVQHEQHRHTDDEAWRYYPDDAIGAYRGLHAGDTRAAVAPALAHHVSLCISTRLLCYANDDAVCSAVRSQPSSAPALAMCSARECSLSPRSWLQACDMHMTSHVSTSHRPAAFSMAFTVPCCTRIRIAQQFCKFQSVACGRCLETTTTGCCTAMMTQRFSLIMCLSCWQSLTLRVHIS